LKIGERREENDWFGGEGRIGKRGKQIVGGGWYPPTTSASKPKKNMEEQPVAARGDLKGTRESRTDRVDGVPRTARTTKLKKDMETPSNGKIRNFS